MSDFTLVLIALAVLGLVVFVANRMEASVMAKHALLKDEIQRINKLAGPEVTFPSGFAVRVSYTGFVCLPVDLAREDLVDITPVGTHWKLYMEESTGKVHDSEAYWKQLLAITSGNTDA